MSKVKGFLILAIVAIIIVTMAIIPGCKTTTAAETTAAAETTVAVETTAAVAETTAAETTKKAGTMTVAVSVMFSHVFWDVMNNGIKDVMEPKGYKLIQAIGEFNVQKQISDTEDFITQKVDGIFIEPYDSVAIKPALEAAKKAGIPVICLDSPALDVDLVEANITTDNYDAGVKCAEDMIKKLNGKGNVVVLDSPTAYSTLQRANGFVDTMKSKAPDMVIVAQQSYELQEDKALAIMENILQTQKDIQAVFGVQESGAFGAITAMEAVNRLKGVLVYSINGASSEVKMIKAGKLTATSAQQPYVMGKLGGEAMLKVLAGEKVDKKVLVPVIFVTIENADTYVPVY